MEDFEKAYLNGDYERAYYLAINKMIAEMVETEMVENQSKESKEKPADETDVETDVNFGN